MKKDELILAIAEEMHVAHDRSVSKADIDAFITAFGHVTSQALADKDDVTLPGVGKLSTGQRAERQGRNPKTGEAITIPAATVAKFTPAKSLKDLLNS